MRTLFSRGVDEQVDDGVDCVRADQIVVKPQMITRRSFQLVQNWRGPGDERATSAGGWSLNPLTSSIRTTRGES